MNTRFKEFCKTLNITKEDYESLSEYNQKHITPLANRILETKFLTTDEKVDFADVIMDNFGCHKIEPKNEKYKTYFYYLMKHLQNMTVVAFPPCKILFTLGAKHKEGEAQEKRKYQTFQSFFNTYFTFFNKDEWVDKWINFMNRIVFNETNGVFLLENEYDLKIIDTNAIMVMFLLCHCNAELEEDNYLSVN